MPTVKPLYSAIYLSDDLGVRLPVTAGHGDIESAKAAVERWCEEKDRDRPLGGEVVVCSAQASRLREVLRWSGGAWLGRGGASARTADENSPQDQREPGRAASVESDPEHRAPRAEL